MTDQKKINADDKITSEEEKFQYEVSSDKGTTEIVETIEEGEQETHEIEKEPRRRTIKILSERDMEIKEMKPPNYSPYLVCFLHFKNNPYKKGRMLDQKQS